MIKDAEEIEPIRRARNLADIGIEEIRNCLRKRIRENEVAVEAAYAMKWGKLRLSHFPSSWFQVRDLRTLMAVSQIERYVEGSSKPLT